MNKTDQIKSEQHKIEGQQTPIDQSEFQKNKQKGLKMTNSKLEFDVIREQLKAYAISEAAKQQIDHLEMMQDPVLIERHLDETTEAAEILKINTSVPLNGLEGVRSALAKLKREEVLRPKELEAVAYFLKDCQRMIRFMADKAYAAPKVVTYASGIDSLEDLSDAIGQAIVNSRVDDHATQTLYKIRRKIAEIEDRIRQKLNQYLTGGAYQHMFADALVSQRDGRYVIPVKSEHKKAFDGNILDRSRSGNTLFIEPAAVKKLQEELTGLRGDEEQELYKILSTLSNQVAHEMRELELNYEVMTHYDFIFAKGKMSRKMDGVAAELTNSKALKIVMGRHPLLEEKAVPLNLEMKQPKRHLVITGPNTGGKTVCMKTIGLFVLMTQAGLHIPAESGTKLPIFDSVLCDIGDGQSIAQNLSTFSSHITNIIEIIERTTSRTLVILDEIGAGTDPGEGMGIGIAVLEQLAEKAAMILASTHYNEIKDFANTHPLFLNGSMAFNLQSLKPAYRLIIGKSGDSNALLIALRLGMDKALIERAHELCYREKGNYDEIINTFNIAPSQVSEDYEVQTKQKSGDECSCDSNGVSKQTTVEPNLRSDVFVKRKKPKFQVGDAVYVHTMKRTGIVLETEDRRGDITIQVRDKKFKVNHKRLSLHIKSDELYPEDYDMEIVTKSWDYRKKNKMIQKGKGKGVVIENE